MLHSRGVQGAAGPDGGETEGDEAGGQHIQEDRQPYPGWAYRELDVTVTVQYSTVQYSIQAGHIKC